MTDTAEERDDPGRQPATAGGGAAHHPVEGPSRRRLLVALAAAAAGAVASSCAMGADPPAAMATTTSTTTPVAGPLDDSTLLRGVASLSSLAVVTYSVAANLPATWPPRGSEALTLFGTQHRGNLDEVNATLASMGLDPWTQPNQRLADGRMRSLFRRSEVEPAEVLVAMRDLEWMAVDHSVFVAANASLATVRQLAARIGAASARRAGVLAVGGLQTPPADALTTSFRQPDQILP